jgi:small subunit ribosomal protein S16
MPVCIKLVRRSFKNHRDYCVIAQSYRRNLFAPPLELLGYWNPIHKWNKQQREIALNFEKIKYYLGNGAQPTKGSLKLLAKVGMIPKKPLPLGSMYSYLKPQKPISILYSREQIDRRMKESQFLLDSLKKYDVFIQQSKDVKSEDTSDLDPMNVSPFVREGTFNILRKKFDSYMDYFYAFNGLDYRSVIYVTKLNKLSLNGFGLDFKAELNFYETIRKNRELIERVVGNPHKIKGKYSWLIYFITNERKATVSEYFSENKQVPLSMAIDQQKKTDNASQIKEEVQNSSDTQETTLGENSQKDETNIKIRKEKKQKILPPINTKKIIDQVLGEQAHLMTYNQYIKVYPNASMDDYHKVIHRPCEFQDFVFGRDISDKELMGKLFNEFTNIKEAYTRNGKSYRLIDHLCEIADSLETQYLESKFVYVYHSMRSMHKGKPGAMKKLMDDWCNYKLPMEVYKKTTPEIIDPFVMNYLTDRTSWVPNIQDNSENSFKINPYHAVSAGEGHYFRPIINQPVAKDKRKVIRYRRISRPKTYDEPVIS